MIKVVKVGGHVLDDPAQLETFCQGFAALEGPKVLVHGGGALASRLQRSLGQEPIRIAGRRVTDAETLQVVTMACAGWSNKQLVSLLQAKGCNALGLSGCDANVVCARKRPPLTIDGKAIDFGYVGDVTPASVRVSFLKSLVDAGIVPVLSPINHDGAGNLLNTNADTMAASVAAALGAELWLTFEKKGVLSDVNDEDSVISCISKADVAALQEAGIVADGMLPKLENAFKALEGGASRAYVLQATLLDPRTGTELFL